MIAVNLRLAYQQYITTGINCELLRGNTSRTYLQVAFLLIILRRIWRRIGYVSRCL